MGKFEDTPEYKQMIKMQSACNGALCKVFKIAEKDIERFPHGSTLFILDKEFAIDIRVKLYNGITLTGQEKALSYKFHSFGTFTIEFYQNRHTKEPGEFFHIASQFYLHGYSDVTGENFKEYYVIDVLKLMVWLSAFSIKQLESKTRPAAGSRASFLPIKYSKIPNDCILYHYTKEAVE